MAWLLHEPRLRAEVPVFCVVAIKPFLRNASVPLPVSVGAVQLLSHLHSRLEVLVKDDCEEEAEAAYENNDTPVLWESCWAPILRVLADGCADDRQPVRHAAVAALSTAILDRHAQAVPAAVMIGILQDIIIPTVLSLGQSLLTATPSKIASVNDLYEGEQMLQDIMRDDEEKISQRPSLLDEEPTDSEKEKIETSQGVLQKMLRSVALLRELETGCVCECLSALCKAFLLQLKKLSLHQAFDPLWMRILDLFSFFLLSAENDGKFNEEISFEAKSTVVRCYEHLRSVLRTLTLAGMFDNKHRTRWNITHDKLLLLNQGSVFLNEVFQDCRKDSAPIVR